MVDPHKTLDALNVLMNGWQPLPKKFCLEKIFGWAEKDAELFLKEYKKEKKKKEKLDKKTFLSAVSNNCCGTDCCSKD